MRLFTFKPIAFLRNLLAANGSSDIKKESFTVISINNNISVLLEVSTVAYKILLKSIGFSFFNRLIKNISQYILVGENKSAAINSTMIAPTVNMIPGYCG